MARTENIDIDIDIVNIDINIDIDIDAVVQLMAPYFVDLRFSQLNNCICFLEGCHLPSVGDEGLHNSWSWRQNHRPIQIWIELLLTETHQDYLVVHLWWELECSM